MWWDLRASVAEFADDVNQQHMLFSTTMQRLLDPMILDYTLMKKMAHNPKHLKWQDQSFTRSLDLRLSGQHALFLRIIKRVAETMHSLKRQLHVSDISRHLYPKRALT